jgi:ferredoxin
MRKAAYLAKDRWKQFVLALSGRGEVYAPCKDGEAITFRRTLPDETPCLDGPAISAPKAVIYPQSETLFSFDFKKDSVDQGKTNIDLRAETEGPPAIILCDRPCDAKGFTIIDRVFLGVDPYYTERRERTTIITLTCDVPYAGCFCTSVGGGPHDATGSDVLLTDISHGYYMEVLTDKGAEALKGIALVEGAPYAKEAEERRIASREALKPAFPGGGEVRSIPVQEAFWEEISQKCLGCGACTCLCPTCYCFNITDEQGVNKGERIRSWDSCMFTHFTLEASGHNPRSQKWQRLRNRVAHKFVHYPETYGEPACTGCGRCIRLCPASIQISGIAAGLAAPSEKNYGD